MSDMLPLPWAARMAAGGTTNSLGTGKIELSIAISSTTPPYPHSCTQWNHVSIKDCIIGAAKDGGKSTDGKSEAWKAWGRPPGSERHLPSVVGGSGEGARTSELSDVGA